MRRIAISFLLTVMFLMAVCLAVALPVALGFAAAYSPLATGIVIGAGFFCAVWSFIYHDMR